jgi:hypothetical protein
VFCSGEWLATNLRNLQTHVKDLNNFFAFDWHEKLLFTNLNAGHLKNSEVFLLIKKTCSKPSILI